jgi:hypothetical protein
MKYSYCESVHARPLGPWHIRRLTFSDKKTGGGVDTTSLCGLVKPPYGWDLEVEFGTTADKNVCHKCLSKYNRLAERGE